MVNVPNHQTRLDEYHKLSALYDIAITSQEAKLNDVKRGKIKFTQIADPTLLGLMRGELNRLREDKEAIVGELYRLQNQKLSPPLDNNLHTAQGDQSNVGTSTIDNGEYPTLKKSDIFQQPFPVAPLARVSESYERESESSSREPTLKEPVAKESDQQKEAEPEDHHLTGEDFEDILRGFISPDETPDLPSIEKPNTSSDSPQDQPSESNQDNPNDKSGSDIGISFNTVDSESDANKLTTPELWDAHKFIESNLDDEENEDLGETLIY